MRDLGALVSALTRPFGGTAAGEFYPDLEQKAAALCHGLVREHPFADANHRTGMAASVLLLERPSNEVLAAPREEVLGRYWRLLFHATAHRELPHREPAHREPAHRVSRVRRVANEQR